MLTRRATITTIIMMRLVTTTMATEDANRAEVVPLPPCGTPCGGEPGRGVDADLPTAAGDPSQAPPGSAQSSRGSPSSAISPARRERECAAPEAISGPDLQRLLAWLSPTFPVGAFTYSHGLEWAVEDGTVTDAATLAAWLGDLLRHGAGRTDAILFAHAYRAVHGDTPALQDLVELAAAFQPSKERHLEATAQGRAFLSTITAAWPSARLAGLLDGIPSHRPITYAIAVAMTAAANDIPAAPALMAYLAAFVANLVSAGVRTIPIGQTDGQRIIASTVPLIEATAAAALAAELDQLGGATLRADIASMKHETQYTRLFRS
jgi:urease accessory protein